MTLRGQSALDLIEGMGFRCQASGWSSHSALRLPSWRSEVAIYSDLSRFLPKQLAGLELDQQLHYIMYQNNQLSKVIPGAKFAAGGLPECLLTEYFIRITYPGKRLFDLESGHLGTSTTTEFNSRLNFALCRENKDGPMSITVVNNEEFRPNWLSMAGFFVPKNLPVK